VLVLRKMLEFEGFRRWPLRVTILDDEVMGMWRKAEDAEGMIEVPWNLVEVTEEAVDMEGTTQERKRDLNLRKLKTLELNDCT